MHKFLALALLVLVAATGVADAQTRQIARVPWLSAEDNFRLGTPYVIPPGLYIITPLHSGVCLSWREDPGLQEDHVVQGPCRGVGFMILPAEGVAQYTIRPVAWSRGRYHLCTTIARNVWIGAPRIDVRECDLPDGSTSWASAGGAGQRFYIRHVANGVYEIASFDQTCWDVRDASRDIGADLLNVECSGGAHQRFRLTRDTGILDRDVPQERAFMLGMGWRDGPRPTNYRRAIPVRGVDLPGHDYDSFPTDDDGGEACATRCAADARCTAFTWGSPAIGGDEGARCWLKDGLPSPAANDATSSGFVNG
jgi:hypothetical protein